jgi:aminopeptidase N
MKHNFLLILFVVTCITGHTQEHWGRYRTIDVQHYRLELALNDTTDIIYGHARIAIQFKQPVSSFHLDLEAETSNGRGMMITELLEGDQLVEFQHEGRHLRIRLPEAPEAGEIRTYEITYHGIPSDGLYIATNRFGDRTFFGDNWPDRAWHWIPTVDHPSDKATVEWIVTAPDHYQVVGNGRQIEETNLDNGQKLTHWRMDVVIPTKVMVIGVARFGVRLDGFVDNVPVLSWIYPEDRKAGYGDYGIADTVLRFFVDRIAPYPYEKLANVQSKTRFGGMENASNIFYSERSVSGTRSVEFLIAHEIAHQWFGNSASEMSWHHVWLSEGFATYLTHLYAEATRDGAFLRDRMRQDRTRVVAFHRQNPVPVIDTTITDYFDLLNPNSYQKGGWILHMLRREIGDDAFWNGLRAYYQQYKFSNALSSDFRDVMEEVSGEDLTTFFEQWLYHPGQPTLRVHTDQHRRRVEIQIEQMQPGIHFEFPLDIRLRFEDGSSEIRTYRVTDRVQTFRDRSRKTVASVELDPDVWLLYDQSAAQQ